MGVIVITPPTDEPVSLSEAKTHLRVDGNEDDEYIMGLVTAARIDCEKRQRRAYVAQTMEYSLDAFPSGRRIELPRPPLRSVVSVTYTDEDGNEHVLDPSSYLVDTRSMVGAVVLKPKAEWPTVALTSANGVVVRYLAGYGAPADVPQTVKQAMLLMIGHWYEHRETVNVGNIVNEVPMAATHLLNKDRVSC